MIASTVLALVVTNSVGTLTQSGKSFSKSRERDAISALIAKDLEGLRATAFNYMRCDPSPSPMSQPVAPRPVTIPLLMGRSPSFRM
ncbi:hypothetical protein KBY57_11650 [Cyanobium sp. Aljojuca 7D2]|uniref:hypothetical protein n=1 Tax=Cyanobium sp. Aljojuca 7D2 TaxID=2823698 RepID=UPI0020CD19CF|nr:hypothetical protein [Cyanobium sp. Aljojuca 7D2]MCP9891700.1 hypothetical protein [Cyanobium sp. Aljojuca 7D2]